jgi:transposase-like protein
VPVQRCTVHKHRNLLAHAPERFHEEATADYTDMIYAATPAQIGSRRKTFIRKWRLKCRAVADSLEEAGDRLFTFTRLPPSQWLCSVLHIQLQAMKSRTAQLGARVGAPIGKLKAAGVPEHVWSANIA